MTEAADIAVSYARRASDERISDRVRTIEESGTQIISLDDHTRSEIRNASESVYEKIRQSISPEIYNSYMNEK